MKWRLTIDCLVDWINTGAKALWVCPVCFEYFTVYRAAYCLHLTIKTFLKMSIRCLLKWGLCAKLFSNTKGKLRGRIKVMQAMSTGSRCSEREIDAYCLSSYCWLCKTHLEVLIFVWQNVTYSLSLCQLFSPLCSNVNV